MKLGTDIVLITGFRKIKKTDYKHWENVFTKKEWKYSFSDKSSAVHLAGIFAAKEAAMKATGRVGKDKFKEFEVTHLSSGKPKLNTKGALLSISHNKDTAIAVVIIV